MEKPKVMWKAADNEKHQNLPLANTEAIFSFQSRTIALFRSRNGP